LWFKKRRGLATGMVYGGAGLGAAVIGLTLDSLITKAGIEGALRILGVSAWVICMPASFFVKPPTGRHGSVMKMQW
jgi:hypothetical protein